MVVAPGERIRLVLRPHAITLVPGFGLALALTAAGLVGLVAGWPWIPVAAVALVLGALVALQAAWRWEGTKVVVTDDRVYLVEGTLRRRTTASPTARGVEVTQDLAGRMLGYGTLVAGELEVPFLPDPGGALRALR
jgi:membrane protein YdbS with pleckstrin-like domain